MTKQQNEQEEYKLDNADSIQNYEQQWLYIRSRLRGEMGEAIFNSWFKKLQIHNVTEKKVVLQVPTRFIRSWIEAHYSARILECWHKENDALEELEIVVKEENPVIRVSSEIRDQSVNKNHIYVSQQKSKMLTQNKENDRYLGHNLGAVLDERYTFDNFIVGKSNELAHAAALRVVDSNTNALNPLFLYGGVGLGKTHLMHAISWKIRRHDSTDKKVLYVSAEKFMYQFIRALRFKDTMAFKQQFREVDVLMVDDIQFIAGKESTQEEFFHTFNALIDNNRQVIISADRSPADLEGIEERIRSRLGWGLVADIHPTDYELRVGILQSKTEKFMNRNIHIPQEVLEFLAQRIVSNIRVLEGALNRVVAFASLGERTVSVDMAKEVLRDLLQSSDKRIKIGEIQRKVAEYYNIRMGDMLSVRRSRSVARPRQIAMYISKQMTVRSLPDIGRKFGGRDHTTVIHAVKRIEQLIEVDPAIEEDIHILMRSIEG